ncbi:hypothetical protein CsSME_00052992 [Camellia sinensis var. sinensis]
MEEQDQKELQLLPPTASSSSSSSLKLIRSAQSDPYDGPSSLDLQLSISVRPIRPPRSSNCVAMKPIGGDYSSDGGCVVEALRWQAAEQIRLAAMEKAYAERVRELSRREMEDMWERACQEVEKAERMKEKATRRRIDSTSTTTTTTTCMEITCQSCRQKFRP